MESTADLVKDEDLRKYAKSLERQVAELARQLAELTQKYEKKVDELNALHIEHKQDLRAVGKITGTPQQHHVTALEKQTQEQKHRVRDQRRQYNKSIGNFVLSLTGVRRTEPSISHSLPPPYGY